MRCDIFLTPAFGGGVFFLAPPGGGAVDGLEWRWNARTFSTNPPQRYSLPSFAWIKNLKIRAFAIHSFQGFFENFGYVPLDKMIKKRIIPILKRYNRNDIESLTP